MSERFRLNCKRLLMGVACGLAMLVLASGQARAGTLEIVISDGTTSYDILDDGPLDTLVGPNAIQALAQALIFPDFKVVGLNASTNNPGMENPTGANLIVGGEIQRITAGGPQSITISVTDTDYTHPADPKEMHSNSSSVFTSVPSGDTHTFTSWYNPNNTPFATQQSSGPIKFTSVLVPPNTDQSNSAGLGLVVPVSGGSPYSLTSTTVLSLSGTVSGATPDVTFGGTTTILTVVPEPASLAIMLPALPVVIMGWFRHRKARATSAS